MVWLLWNLMIRLLPTEFSLNYQQHKLDISANNFLPFMSFVESDLLEWLKIHEHFQFTIYIPYNQILHIFVHCWNVYYNNSSN